MAHCISAIVMKKEILREDKINSVLENTNTTLDKIKYVELPQGIILISHIDSNPRELSKELNTQVGTIWTDYFGGPGEQGAKLYDNGDKLYDQDDMGSWDIHPINDVLKMMGVIKENGMDEFDTIHLGRYRNNQAIDTNLK